MKSFILPIALQILGMVVILVEIFVPSFGILSVIAAGILLYSLYLVFADISNFMGLVFLGADLVILPILLILGMKALGRSGLSLHKALSSKEGVASQAPDLPDWIGKQGEAATDLRPSGTAVIDGRRLDVVTDGEYVEAGSPVVVAQVSGNRIVVEKPTNR